MVANYSVSCKSVVSQLNIGYHYLSAPTEDSLLDDWRLAATGYSVGVCFWGGRMKTRKTPEDYHKLAESRGFEWVGEFPSTVRHLTEWKCEFGHLWVSTYDNLQQRTGCHICKGYLKKTAFDYESLASQRGFKWIGTYPKNTDTKTKWACPLGHTWLASYRSVKINNCPICSGRNKKEPIDYNNIAIDRGFTWLGPYVDKVNKSTSWRCIQGHIWQAKYNDIQQGQGCPRCAGNMRKLPDDYYQLARLNELTWLGPIVYKTGSKTRWSCKNGHQWEGTYNDIQQGGGCSHCKATKKENRIAKFLDNLNINYERQKRFDKCKNKKPLPFDFYINSSSILIEYDGEQHFGPIACWGGQKGFDRCQKHDAIKTKFAQDNGFILIRIPYTELDIENFLRERLSLYV